MNKNSVENEENMRQLDSLEDEVWAGSLSYIELAGWFMFIASLLIWVLVTKLSFNIGPYGWLFLIVGLVLVGFGSYNRVKSNSNT